MIDRLYYGPATGSLCRDTIAAPASPQQPSMAAQSPALSGEGRGGASNSLQGAISISPEVIARHLRRIYEAKNPTGRWIESGMYQAVRDILASAVSQSFPSVPYAATALPPQPSPSQPSLSASLTRSADVFAAFKVHRMQRDMARLLTDDQGQLRSFSQWRDLVAPIASHQVGPWLQTEYNTAVLRARQAAQWQQFQAEADVLPNLRWVPSTSPNPGADHEVFWNTVLPVNDPFWDRHRPGDRWNCKCSLEATDDRPTGYPKGYELRGNGPQPGLNENPGKTGRLFAQSHPYYPQTCAQCAFYEPGQSTQLKNAQGKCENCPFLQKCIDKTQPSPKGYAMDKEYGERLQISNCADKSELEDNVRAARAILDAFPDLEIKIRQHVIEHCKKNPEYEINGVLADRKGVEGINGITDGFRKAILQQCGIVVIDLDKHLYDKRINYGKLAGKLKGRHQDFTSGLIQACFIIRHNKVAKIEKECYESGNDNETKKAILSIIKEKIKE